MNEPCPICGRPIEDTAYVCARCAAALARDLRKTAAAWHEIETTITRQSASLVMPGGGVRREPLTPHGPAHPPQQLRPGGRASLAAPSCEHQSCAAILWAQYRARDETPLPHEDATPANLAASEDAWIIRNTVTTWARLVCELREIQIPKLERPHVLQVETLHVIHDRPRPSAWWCDYGDLPAAVCACGNPNATHPRRIST